MPRYMWVVDCSENDETSAAMRRAAGFQMQQLLARYGFENVSINYDSYCIIVMFETNYLDTDELDAMKIFEYQTYRTITVGEVMYADSHFESSHIDDKE